MVEKIKHLVENGYTEDAMEQLIALSSHVSNKLQNQISTLKAGLIDLNRKFYSGIISQDEHKREIDRINYSILGFLSDISTFENLHTAKIHKNDNKYSKKQITEPKIVVVTKSNPIIGKKTFEARFQIVNQHVIYLEIDGGILTTSVLLTIDGNILIKNELKTFQLDSFDYPFSVEDIEGIASIKWFSGFIYGSVKLGNTTLI